MSASACRHPGTLERRDDGAHCPHCDALIYLPPAPEPGPAPVPVPAPAEAGR